MRLIDADTLRDALGITGTKDTCKGCQYNKRFNFACNTDDAPSFEYVCEAIDEAPTIDAVPVRRGKWIYGNDFHWYTASCSVCGYKRRTDIKATGWNQWKYCPMCGTKTGDTDGKAE